MNFYSTNMINTSTRLDTCNSIRITVKDTFSDDIIGTAQMLAFDDIYLDIPEKQGRYKLKTRAITEMRKHDIENLDDVLRKGWLLDNGDYILRQLVAVK